MLEDLGHLLFTFFTWILHLNVLFCSSFLSFDVPLLEQWSAAFITTALKCCKFSSLPWSRPQQGRNCLRKLWSNAREISASLKTKWSKFHTLYSVGFLLLLLLSLGTFINNTLLLVLQEWSSQKKIMQACMSSAAAQMSLNKIFHNPAQKPLITMTTSSRKPVSGGVWAPVSVFPSFFFSL